MSVARKDILNGWKEIAGYVARDIRTVERWEKQRGLPVRRVPGAGRATVYARISELEEWLASAKPEFETTAETVNGNGVPAPGGIEALASAGNGIGALRLPGDLPVTARAVDDHDAAANEQPTSQRGWRTSWSVAVAACCIVAVSASLWVRHNRHVAAAARSAAATHAVSYASKVPGVEDLYLRGTYFYERRSPETLNQAMASFTEAIHRDPQYAPAYAGLANTYNLLREYSVMPDSEAYPKAKAAAERAIALEPNLAQAYVPLGFADYFWYLDAARAEREFKTAIALDPNLAQAHHWYGSVLTHEGRYDEALHELDLAQHLQPTSAAILTTRALALGLNGQATQARAMVQDLLKHDSSSDMNSVTEHSVLATISLPNPRDVPGFLENLRRVAELRQNKEAVRYVDTAIDGYKRGGEQAAWRAVLLREQARPVQERSLFRLAQCEANLGDFDHAFADLNTLVDQHDKSISGLWMDPLFEPLHKDPRYAQLRERARVPPLAKP